MIDPNLQDKVVLITGANHGIGQSDHLADVILFMASEQARWVTGQLIYVGGGWRMGQ